MDPDEALRRMRAAIETITTVDDRDPSTRTAEDLRKRDAAVTALVDHAQALDGWISNGGFLPASWGGRSRRA